jgi:hypothetical protein
MKSWGKVRVGFIFTLLLNIEIGLLTSRLCQEVQYFLCWIFHLVRIWTCNWFNENVNSFYLLSREPIFLFEKMLCSHSEEFLLTVWIMINGGWVDRNCKVWKNERKFLLLLIPFSPIVVVTKPSSYSASVHIECNSQKLLKVSYQRTTFL